MSDFAKKLLNSVKLTLRELTSDFDEEIASYIDACASDLQDAGISSSFFLLPRDQDVDSQILQAVRLYCLSKYGLYNADSEKYALAYNSLKATLCTQKRYTKKDPAVITCKNGHGMFYSVDSEQDTGVYQMDRVTIPEGFTLRPGDFVFLSTGYILYVTSVEASVYTADTILSVVPEITDSDNGKVLMASNGKWEPADIFPMYDLVSLGLPTINIDNDQTVISSSGFSEFIEALGREEAIKIKFEVKFGDHVRSMIEVIHPVNANPSARKEFVCTFAIDSSNIVFLIFRVFENETNILRISSIPLDKKIAKEIEQRLPMQMLPTPILSLENNNWIVHRISTDATMIEFWDGSLVYQYMATNGRTEISTPAPTDGKIRNVAVRVTADGYHPSAFSNTVVYPNLNNVMTEFVKTRRSLSRVYFPFYSDFPYNDINNRVKLGAVDVLGTHRSLPITDDAQNVIVPAIDGAEKCLLLNGNNAGKQNRRLAFTRCEFLNNDSVTASNARPDEMVVDPFPRKECTIEMWINSQTTNKGCLFASVSREDDGGTPNFYDFYWDTFNENRCITLNMQTEKPQTAGVSEGIQMLQVGGVSKNDKGWFHLVFTQEVVGGETITLLYVNGTLRERWNPIPLFHDCQTARAIYSIGAPCGEDGNCFDGVIHSFGIYDFVWNAAQVKAVYEAEKE